MKAKILIIDDETAILNALQIFLQQEGYDVEAIEKYENLLDDKSVALPDLIILDIILLDEDGRAIAKRLKANSRTSHIPIIMISAHPNASTTSLKAGANAFLPKPFDIDDLLDTIARLLNASPQPASKKQAAKKH